MSWGIKQHAARVAVGLDTVLPARNVSGAVGVLTYHRTAPPTAVDAFDDLNVAPETFREQLAGLQDRGFRFVSIAEFVRWHGGETDVPPKSVLVTFDDGYASTRLYAEPILAELGIPATVFLNTAYVGSDEAFPFDPNRGRYGSDVPLDHYRPLRRDEVAAMVAGGVITVGGHSHTHDNFAARPERFALDVGENLRILNEDYGQSPVPFAFPYGVVRDGYAGGELSRTLSGLAVTCGFSTEPELIRRTSDRFCLGRFSAYPFDTSRTLEAKLNGWYGWVPRAQALLTRA